jgi:hypothetical protein
MRNEKEVTAVPTPDAGNGELMPFNHVTLNTGHNCEIPVGKVGLVAISALRDVIKSGGGPVPTTGGRYRFILTADKGDCCAFSIWKGAMPIVLCTYQGLSPTAGDRWRSVLRAAEIATEVAPCATKISKPAEPWLSTLLFPAAAFATSDLSWLADFEQCVAETWRRMPDAERATIQANDPDGLLDVAAESGQSRRPGHGTPDGAVGRLADEETARLIERLTRRNEGLRSRVRSLKEASRSDAAQMAAMAGLRRESERLRHELSSKEMGIKALEAANVAIHGEIDRRVAEQVADVRRAAEESELRALAAEEERDAALRRTEKAERRTRLIEGVLRKHGFDLAEAFVEAEPVACAEE